MKSETIASLTGLDTVYNYRELTKVPDSSVRAYAEQTRSKFGVAVRTFDDDKNLEWLIRSYLALKYVLASTVLGTSAIHAEEENLKVTLPYLNYYTMLNCARAFIFTLPCTEWKGEKSIAMTHNNIINTTGDKLRRLDTELATATKSTLIDAQRQRELFSYRFPASGLSVFGDELLTVADAIVTARLLVELTQFNLSCLEAAILKKKKSFSVSDHDSIWKLMKYDTRTQDLIDDDDYHRVGYFLRKFNYPCELVSMATPGLVEDFFGAWVHENEDAKGYDPDNDWTLLLDIM